MAVIGDHLLNKTATITTPSLTSDGQGGDIESFVAHPTNPTLPFRYYAASAKDLIVAARDDEYVQYIGYLKPDAVIERDDRVLVDGQLMDVVAVLPPSEAHHRKIQLSQTKV